MEIAQFNSTEIFSHLVKDILHFYTNGVRNYNAKFCLSLHFYYPYCAVLFSFVKVTQYLRGCPSEKNSYARCFKVNYHKLYINRKVKNCRTRKKYSLFGGAIIEKKEADRQKTTECDSAELFGYQTQPLLQKHCTMLISKYQSLKGCQAFS